MAFYEAPGLRHPLARVARGYDLVFANILARPLMRLAPSLARAVATDGTLVLSGLIPATCRACSRPTPRKASACAAAG